MTRTWLLVVLAVMAPAAARAQEATEVPEPEPDATPSEELAAPTAPVATPEGYGDLTLPDLTARPVADPDRVRLDVLSYGDRPLTLHLRNDQGGRPITDHCTAPCRLDLTPGRYHLSVQPRGADPRNADDQPVWVSGPRVAVQMSYDHRIGLRSIGWTLLSLGITAFGLSWIGGFFSALAIGLPVAAVFLIPAIPLIFLEDSARVQVTALPL